MKAPLSKPSREVLNSDYRKMRHIETPIFFFYKLLLSYIKKV